MVRFAVGGHGWVEAARMCEPAVPVAKEAGWVSGH